MRAWECQSMRVREWEIERVWDWESERVWEWESERVRDWESERVREWESERVREYESERLRDWEKNETKAFVLLVAYPQNYLGMFWWRWGIWIIGDLLFSKLAQFRFILNYWFNNSYHRYLVHVFATQVTLHKANARFLRKPLLDRGFRFYIAKKRSKMLEQPNRSPCVIGVHVFATKKEPMCYFCKPLTCIIVTVHDTVALFLLDWSDDDPERLVW